MPSSRPENSARSEHTNRIACGVRQLFASRHGCALLLLVCSVSACAPEIGDECATALDCSASGTRLCDLTQPRGYCTLEGCEADTCPDEAVCVQFGRRIDGKPVDRVSRTFCMFACESSGDCRTGDRYTCFSAKDFGNKRGEAQVLGNPDARFCAPVAPEEPMSSEPDAGQTPDAPDATDGTDAMMSMPEDDGGAA